MAFMGFIEDKGIDYKLTETNGFYEYVMPECKSEYEESLYMAIGSLKKTYADSINSNDNLSKGIKKDFIDNRLSIMVFGFVGDMLRDKNYMGETEQFWIDVRDILRKEMTNGE